MKRYALIFHSTRTLSSEEDKQRAADIAGWVKQVTDQGITLDPRPFGETVASFPAQGSEVGLHNESTDPRLVTIVFFDSSAKDHAVNIAHTNPLPHLGFTVELREWTPPPPRATSPSQ